MYFLCSCLQRIFCPCSFLFFFLLLFGCSCSVSKWHGRIMMGCETPLQIPIVLPSLCFRGNSLPPSGRPSSLSSSHFPLMGFSTVFLPSHFLSVPFLFLFSDIFFFLFFYLFVLWFDSLSFWQSPFSLTFHLSTYRITVLFHSFSNILFLILLWSFSSHSGFFFFLWNTLAVFF